MREHKCRWGCNRVVAERDSGVRFVAARHGEAVAVRPNRGYRIGGRQRRQGKA